MQYTFPADVGPFVDTGIFIKADGSRALTGDWDIGAGRKVLAETIQARADNLILLGSKFGINNPSPVATIDFLDEDLDVNTGSFIASLSVTTTSVGICNNDRGAAALYFAAYNNASPNGFNLNLYGIIGTVRNPDNCLLTDMYGLVGTAVGSHSAGAINSATGLWGVAFQAGGGTVNNGYGAKCQIIASQHATIINAYGLYADLAINDGSTIGTGYGLFINAVVGSTTWGVYVNAAVNNYFAGNVGIGISPTARLHLNSPNGQEALKIETERGGDVTVDEWGNLSFDHNGLGIRYDSNISQVSFNNANDLYISSGWNSTNPFNVLLIPSSTGKIGLLTNSPASPVDINADTVRLRTARTPASAGASGNQGDICWDANYLYVCVTANAWKRVALNTW